MTPTQVKNKLLIMYDYNIGECISYCNNKIMKGSKMPEFYEKVKIELLNIEI